MRPVARPGCTSTTSRAASKPVPAEGRDIGVAAPGTTLLLGRESVGKSALARALTGQPARNVHFRGTTVPCGEYPTPSRVFVDTPGLHRASDADTVRLTLEALQEADEVLLVASATQLDEDLDLLLPLVQGRRASVAVTRWDLVADHAAAREAIARMALETGLPFVVLDARHPDPAALEELQAAVAAPGTVRHERTPVRAGLRIEPRRGLLDHAVAGPAAGVALLILPALLAVLAANQAAAWLEPLVDSVTIPLAERIVGWPGPLGAMLAGDYGLLTMGPLLFVWAMPTVLVYAVLLAVYKASGLADRIGTAIHPLLRPIGLHGRDVTRVLMGFGCNVPAIVSTRSCSACTRPTTVGAIAFGSACSYQLGATLAVFAAAGRSSLVVPYLALLVAATLVYARLTSDPVARSPLNTLLIEPRTFLTRPSLAAVGEETRGMVSAFLRTAVPTFFAIAMVASLLDWSGVLDAAGRVLGPAMAVFALPVEAALPTVLAAIRKDGILLLAEEGTVASLSASQLLVATFLAGTVLPCLV
ncbi:MAG: ferrous iron transporter B, partial [Chloroflexi bacterium]|nr:ferrous iron transporter B [Chloroflexota bacterium]